MGEQVPSTTPGRFTLGRRDFLRATGATVGVAALGTAAGCTPAVPQLPGIFNLGVASGLHSPSEVVLWTRVDLANAPTLGSIAWEVATSADFSTIVDSGTAAVSAASDGCVKVLVGGLNADTSYWYRFTGGSETSAVGRARTVPAANSTPESLRAAFCSCQSYASGYYGAWRDIATQDLDFVLFLGDYIYEALAIQLLRKVRDESTSTVETLAAYRDKYRLYRSDHDLQAAHAAHPFLAVWDDHEISNDYDSTIFSTAPERAAAAYQAWFEYMPVWPTDGNRIYRNIRWGTLGEVFCLDSRQYRDEHLGTSLLGILGLQVMTSDLQAEGRSLLGAAQRQWLLDSLDQSQAAGVQWKLVGNPVMIAPLRIVDLDTPELNSLDPSLPKHAGLYMGTDSWDGFGWERDLLLAHIGDSNISDVSFLTGDYHAFFGAPLTPDFDDPSAPNVAYEYVGGSISSPSGITDHLFSGGLNSFTTQPPFDYGNINANGYGIVECTAAQMTVTYMQLDPTTPVGYPTPAITFTAQPGTVVPTITA